MILGEDEDTELIEDELECNELIELIDEDLDSASFLGSWVLVMDEMILLHLNWQAFGVLSLKNVEMSLHPSFCCSFNSLNNLSSLAVHVVDSFPFFSLMLL